VAPLDVTGLAPVSADAPAGENLELDPEFGALERAAQGKPEVQYGNTIEPAVPPDWKETTALAEALMERTHDLRVMVHLAIARLHLEGLPGFARVVRLIRNQLESEWPHIHPQLDPEDDNDPMQRSNAVLLLQDPARVLRTIRALPLATTPRTGPISWRDMAVLNGAAEPEPGKEKVTEAIVLGAFRECDQGRLAAVRDAVNDLVTDIPGISKAFDTQAGPATGPDYEPLTKLLREIQRDLKRYETVADAPDATAEETPDAAEGEPSAPRTERAPSRAFASIMAITSLSRREEALHALDLAAAYFRTQEPSSPAPLLLDRAKRLAGMEFMDILRDLAPEGISQAQTIAGTPPE
jgi:type VI secretion system protein ImpA